MDALIERLRARKAFGLNGTWMMLNEPDADCQMAADEIERLRIALRLVRTDLKTAVAHISDELAYGQKLANLPKVANSAEIDQ